MRLSRPKSKPATDDNLIPMINVVFLLLIFFMVAGTIDPPVPIDTVPPDSTQRHELTALRTLHIAADGSMALDSEIISLDTLSNALKSVSDEPSNDLLPSLAVRADGDLAMKLLQPVLDSLRDAGVRRIELVTTWAPTGKR